MIDYNPKDWFTFIFRLHKADTLRELFPLMVCIGLYAYGIAYAEKEYFQLGAESSLKNLTILHSILGLVISLLLVFRTNTAYDRWWEGRKMWGSLVNSSRNLAIKSSAMNIDIQTKAEIKNLVTEFCIALKHHLRNQSNDEIIKKYSDKKIVHAPNFIAGKIQKHFSDLVEKKIISDEKLLSINTELTNFADVCGACERIRNTPIPFSYSVFITKFIFFYTMTMPFGFALSLGYYMVPVVVFIFYVLASLELIAEEIEDPFGEDANDLPIDNICNAIQKSVDEIFIPE